MPFPKYQKYSDIPLEYRFDLEALLKGKSVENLFEEVKQASQEILKTKDTYLLTLENYRDYLKRSERMQILNNRLSNYISNYASINIVDPKIAQLREKYLTLVSEHQKNWGNENLRLIAHKELLLSYLKDPFVSQYAKKISYAFLTEKHLLKPEVEKYLDQSVSGETDLNRLFNILTSIELDFGYAASHDQKRKEKITYGSRLLLLQDPDVAIRKSTHLNFNQGNARHKQMLAALIVSHFKKISAQAKARHYQSSVESFLFEDQIDPQLLEIIYHQVKKYVPLMKKYYAAVAKFYTKKFHLPYKSWDRWVQLVKNEQKYTVAEGQKLVLEALKPLGEEYQAKLQEAFSQRWIDYYPLDTKRSGAYSIGNSYGLQKKYICMNWNYTLGAVSTLAHELGHSMHSFYADTKQPLATADYPIILAEIASIYNGLMLGDYLLKNTHDKEGKFFLLNDYIRKFQGTVFRQTQFSEYEYRLYQAIDHSEPYFSFESVQELYAKIEKDYDYFPSEDGIKGENQFMISTTLPHLYYDFYVYKYALGYIVANIFYEDYLQNGKKGIANYINNFLSSGSKKWPSELLKDSQIDIYDPKIYEKAFQQLEVKINHFIELGNEIFKL